MGELYRAELAARPKDRDVLFQFFIHDLRPGGSPVRRLWIMLTGKVLLENLSTGKMKELTVPNLSYSGIVMAAESSIEKGAILNAVGLRMTTRFKKTQARWSLNDWIEALRQSHLLKTSTIPIRDQEKEETSNID